MRKLEFRGMTKNLWQRIRKELLRFLDKLDGIVSATEEDAETAGTSSASSDAIATDGSSASSSGASDEADFSSFSWSWGGFDGSKASRVESATIGSFKTSSNGMRYKWLSGGCEDLGSSSKKEASCLACLFCLRGGKWKGGKFDWISTSRESRSWTNIDDGYNGWSRADFDKAEKLAFVIVSKDGRKRTNVITCGR